MCMMLSSSSRYHIVSPLTPCRSRMAYPDITVRTWRGRGSWGALHYLDWCTYSNHFLSPQAATIHALRLHLQFLLNYFCIWIGEVCWIKKRTHVEKNNTHIFDLVVQSWFERARQTTTVFPTLWDLQFKCIHFHYNNIMNLHTYQLWSIHWLVPSKSFDTFVADSFFLLQVI
jgi:hypothetical protein